jgi:hypothetical protein
MMQDAADWGAFVLAYGFRVPAGELAAIVGREEHEIRALRSSGAVKQLPQRLPYAALFAAWHGRAPDEQDFPVPKRHPGGYAWEPPELVLLATLNGQYGIEALASILTARLRARTGDPEACRTHNSVLVGLQRIGLQTGDLVGGISVQQAAREIGSENIVRAAVDRGTLRTERVGHRVLIPHAAWAEWKAGRQTPPADWVRLSSLRQGLGIKSDKLPEFARAGLIPGAEQYFDDGGKHGVWYVAPDLAQQLLNDRHQGRPMPWHGKPLETNLKQTYQRWCERRHPDTCEDCARIWGDHGAPETLDEFKLRYPALTQGEKRHLTRLPLNKTGAVASAGWSQRRYTLREAADELAMTVAWVRERITRGTIVVVQGDKGQPLVTEAMMKRLRHVWIYRDDDPEPMPTDWLSASAAAREAGVAQATLLKWAESGELERQASKAGWRFQREAVRARARSYWQNVRFKRATPPDWLAAELRA